MATSWIAVAVVVAATVAGAGLARRAVRLSSWWLVAAGGMLLVAVGVDLVPDVWRDVAGRPTWWLAPLAGLAGFAATGVLTRRGCACSPDRSGRAGRPDPPDARPGRAGHSGATDHAGPAGVARWVGSGGVAGTGGGVATAVAIGVHRALEGSTLVVAASVPVVVALVGHAAIEGFAMAGLLDGQPRRRLAAALAVACAGTAAGVLLADRAPEWAEPLLTACVAGVLVRVALAMGGTVKYMLIHRVDESLELSPAEQARTDESLSRWLDDTVGSGVNLHGGRLVAAADAATVRVRDEEVLVADGPFAETKEQVAGYDVIECADLDEALAVAARHPTARLGSIEVRPFRKS